MKTKINHRDRAANFGRQNPFKAILYEYMFAFSSFARIPIEVHTRRKFGERYFSLSSSIFTLLMFCFTPNIIHFFTTNPFRDMGSNGPTFWEILLHNGTLYGYLAYTAYICWLHDKEKKARPSVWDFTMYTKCTGFIDDRILNIRHNGRFATLREIETFFEPLIFFIPGVFLILMSQSLGFLLVFCSVVYALGYRAAYKKGDDEMLDIIDGNIIKEELIDVIVEGRTKAEARGYQFYGNTSGSYDSRRKAANAMAEDIDFEEVK